MGKNLKRGVVMEEYQLIWIEKRETKEFNLLKEKFKKEFLEDISLTEYCVLFYKFFQNKQLKHWDREIFSFLQAEIFKIERKLGSKGFQETLINNFDLWITMFDSLLSIEERINLMELYNGDEEFRAKVFSISLYNDLLNTAYSNGLKLLIAFFSEIEGKEQNQKHLTPQIEYLSKRGFSQITDIPDADIRNGISHGGAKYNNGNLYFRFTKGNKTNIKEISTYQFITDLKEIFDITSAMCLFWLFYMYKNMEISKIITSNYLTDSSRVFFEKIMLSTILFECKEIYQTNIIQTNEKQYNIEFNHNNLDINNRINFGLQTAQQLISMNNLPRGVYLDLIFHSTKSMTSWFKVSTDILEDYIQGKINLNGVINILLSNSMMFEINTEERNDVLDKFHSYLDIQEDGFNILEITDISIESKKRFRAVLILEKEVKKAQLKKMIKEAIDYLVKLENYGFSNQKVKYGSMESDIVYLTVYKEELRRQKKRMLSPENDNFICYVQYDKNKKFPIHLDLVDVFLKKNREGNIEYNWNPNYKGQKSKLFKNIK